MFLKLFIAYGVCAVSANAFAQGAVEPKPPAQLQAPRFKGIVTTDGATVYAQPDFDAQIIDSLPAKAPILINRRAIPGHGGLGLFHNVQYRNQNGYMADTDIRILEREAEAPSKEEPKKQTTREPKRPRSKALPPEPSKKVDPLYFTPYAGGAVALVNFTEKFSGEKLTSKLTMYGLRMTGPVFDGPPIDLNLWFSLQKPGYYKDFSTSLQGFLLFGDIMAMLPMFEWKNSLINYGLGLMWTYTKYNVQVSNSTFDSQELRMGADFDLGYAYRFRPYAVRFDIKYYFEKTQYAGYVFSFQTEF